MSPASTGRVYISGPISNTDLDVVARNVQAFVNKEIELTAFGYLVVNPVKNGLPVDATWEEHMRTDLRMLLDCGAIYMLPGWYNSHGALLEYRVALQLGFVVLGAV